jgi:hypothetical protein
MHAVLDAVPVVSGTASIGFLVKGIGEAGEAVYCFFAKPVISFVLFLSLILVLPFVDVGP